MEQIISNLQQFDIIKLKISQHIHNRQRIKQMYKEKGIQMLQKEELVQSFQSKNEKDFVKSLSFSIGDHKQKNESDVEELKQQVKELQQIITDMLNQQDKLKNPKQNIQPFTQNQIESPDYLMKKYLDQNPIDQFYKQKVDLDLKSYQQNLIQLNVSQQLGLSTKMQLLDYISNHQIDQPMIHCYYSARSNQSIKTDLTDQNMMHKNSLQLSIHNFKFILYQSSQNKYLLKKIGRSNFNNSKIKDSQNILDINKRLNTQQLQIICTIIYPKQNKKLVTFLICLGDQAIKIILHYKKEDNVIYEMTLLDQEF
ncbi:hypothetical protein ABPG73_008493 [Tetrahymena malaccensis]